MQGGCFMPSDENEKKYLDWYRKIVHDMNLRSRNSIRTHQRVHDWSREQSRNALNWHLDLVKDRRQRNAMRDNQLQDLLTSQRVRMNNQHDEQRLRDLGRQPINTPEPIKPPTVYEPSTQFGQQEPKWGPPLPPNDWDPKKPDPVEPYEPFEPPGPIGPPPGWPGR